MQRHGDVGWGKLLALIVVLAFAAVGLTTIVFAVMPDDFAFFTTVTIVGLVLVGLAASMRGKARADKTRGSRDFRNLHG